MATAAGTAGAVKQYVEGLGLGLAVYADWAPDGARLPYVTVTESVSLTFDGNETPTASASGGRTGVEMVQVDLWQPWRNATTRARLEDKTLAPALTRALHGAKLPASPSLVYGVLVMGVVRLFDIDDTETDAGGSYQGIVQTTITANVHREV